MFRSGQRRCRCPLDSTSKSLLREAVEQAVAAGRDEIGLAAAAGHVGRVPGFQIGRGLGGAVDMAEHGAAEGAARPVVAGQVEIRREHPAVRRRAGHGVMLVRLHADAVDHGAFLGERRLARDLVVGAVEIVGARGVSRRQSFFPRWRRPVGQEKWPSSNFWTSSNLNTCHGRQRDR
jgi:hypothetical protein